MKPFVEGLQEASNNVFLLTPYIKNFENTDKKYTVIKYKYIWPDKWHKLGYSRAMKADVDLKLVNFLLLPLMLLFGSISLIRTIKKYKIDVVNVHWIIPNGLMAYLASKITKVPYVITIPGTDAYLVYKSKMFARIAKVIANSSSGIISNSPFLLKRITDLGIKNKPTEIISYPVDVNHLRISNSGVVSLRSKLDIANTDLIIMAVGRLVYKKGFEYLIKAMPKVIKKYPHTKLIIGGDGDLKQDLIRMTKELKIENNILFTGNIERDEILAFYNLADIFIAPSIVDREGNADGGPVVSYESMACGKPQIATDILGVSSIIKNGVNGYVVKQKNFVEISNAINKLLESGEIRKRMGIKNRQLILKSLNTKSIGLKYTDFLKNIIKNEK
jgi:glycosyltransferase involved in cell wall biosynthesis